VSEKQRFAVRESVEIWDERSGSMLATAVSGDRAILIVAALNATYDPPAQPKPMQSAADPVDAPDHYRQGEIECIDAVKAMLGDEGFAYWLRGNMVAYLWRLPHKGEAKKDAGKTRNLAERLERLLAE
jgi:Protein of unknwon function (DUF3310)